MMQTREVELHAPEHPAKRAGGEVVEAIVRPRFYCGQLLTDRDMTALVDWGRQRLALSRFRDGWGVVCGLDIHTTKKARSSVTVEPGYAVGGRGDDILVPKAFDLDLAPVADNDQKRCHDLGITQADELLVDVLLRYGEEDTDPHSAFARSCCAQTTACENSRTCESYHVYGRKAAGPDDPVRTAADAWRLGYDACLAVIHSYTNDFKTFRAADTDARRSWLLRWLAEHPSREEWTLRAEITAAASPAEKDVAGWLFRLAQEARNAYLTGPCPRPLWDGEVRLARVTLRRGEAETWVVGGIDVYPPYRRPLSVDAWPAPLGSVNVAQMIWHRWPEAGTRFADLGVRVEGTSAFTVPDTVAALRGALACSPFVAHDDSIVVEVYGTAQRVVGFCGTIGPVAPEVPLKLSVEKTSILPGAVPGRSTPYRVTVTNNDTVEMTVAITDDAMPFALAPKVVPAGKSVTFEYGVEVPLNATGEVTNTVRVEAAAGTRKGSAEDSLTLSVLGLALTKSGPSSAVVGAPIFYRYAVRNTGSTVDLDVRVDDDVLGPIGSRMVAAGATEQFTKLSVMSEDPFVENTAIARGSVNGQILVDATDSHIVKGVKIDGIGRVRAQALHAAGITTVDELAVATPERIGEILPGINVGLIEKWISTAQEAIR